MINIGCLQETAVNSHGVSRALRYECVPRIFPYTLTIRMIYNGGVKSSILNIRQQTLKNKLFIRGENRKIIEYSNDVYF